MNDVSPLRLWIMRASFVVLALLILLGNLLPLQTVPRGWAAPDFIACFALAWSVRRAEYVPLGLLAVVFLLADLLLGRAPGLVAALMVAGCANIQLRGRMLRTAGFTAEWTRACFVIIGVALMERLVLAILLVDTPPLKLAAFQTLATLLCYPLAVLASAVFFGIRRSTASDLDSYGNRI